MQSLGWSGGAAMNIGSGSGLSLVSTQIITGSAVTTVTFSGLNGDTDKNYFLKCFIRNVTAGSLPIYVNLKPNSGTSNQRNSFLYQDGSTQGAGILGGTSLIQLFQGTAGSEGIATCEISARTGTRRTFFGTSVHWDSVNSIFRTTRWGGNWNDTSTNITSLVIDTMSNNVTSTNAIGVGSEFYLYKYGV
jgi:hypothetical protein